MSFSSFGYATTKKNLVNEAVDSSEREKKGEYKARKLVQYN